MHSRFLLSLAALLAFTLAGCNGQEDFSDAVVAGNIVNGDKPNPNFNPDNPCQSRVVGNLVDSGIVDNIGYECGGYRGYTGEKGIPSEKSQSRFVCPLYSTSVRFFLGGKNDAREYLGTAHFRRAGPAEANFDDQGNNICSYNDVDNEYEAGSVYDADGPYLFSVADLYDGPARVDVITDGAANELTAQNVSALLTGLDISADESLVVISEEAHRVIFDEEFFFPDDFFDVAFDQFISGSGDAQAYISAIGAGDAGALPLDELEVEQSMKAANGSTAAGLYQFDLEEFLYGILYFAEGDSGPVGQENLVSDYLSRTLTSIVTASAAADPENPAAVDATPIVFEQDFWPFMMIDRQSRIIGGGAFDMVRFATGATERLCSNEQPLYLALDGAAGLSSDLMFSQFKFEPTGLEPGEVNIPGRFIDGIAYSGIELADGQIDYDLAYSGPTHVFDPAKDRSLINATSLCGSTIANQPILSFRRQGIVMPKLDPSIMSYFFGDTGPGVSGPKRYTLDFMVRSSADVIEPDQTGDMLSVTIHEDGTILTDLNADGNTSYDSFGDIPTDEHLVGMVSSVIPGEENATTLEEEYITESLINVLVFTLGPKELATTLPAYGSHFRARIVPDGACDVNVMFAAGDPDSTDHALWFDTYNITNWLGQNGSTATDPERYEAFRTKAYGFIEAKRNTDCP